MWLWLIVVQPAFIFLSGDRAGDFRRLPGLFQRLAHKIGVGSLKNLDEQAVIDRKEVQRRALLEEESHYANLSRVFSGPSGIEVLEWLLEVSGYWSRTLLDERAIGKFELGRFVFDQVCLADLNIAHQVLERRRKRAEAVRLKEQRAIESKKNDA